MFETTNFFIVARCCIIMAVLITIVHSKKPPTQNPVCRTQQCDRFADTFLKNMNKHGNPCTDFYDFVCRRWADNNPAHKYVPSWNVDGLIDYKIRVKLREFLEAKYFARVKGITEARALYDACLNATSLERSNKNSMKYINKIGNWPMLLPETEQLPSDFSWWELDNYYLKAAGESAFFEFLATIDSSRNNIIVTQLKQMFSPYGMLKRKSPWIGEEKQHYKNFLKLVIKAVAPINPKPFKNGIDKDLDEVLELRQNILKIQDEATGPFEVLSIRDFQLECNKDVHVPVIAEINWAEKVRAFYKGGKDPYGAPVQNIAMIYLQKDYFKRLINLLGKTPKQVIANHIHLYFAERHVKLDAQMESKLAKSISIDAHPSGYIRQFSPRWEYCVITNSKRGLLGKMYVANTFSKPVKARVEQLVDHTKRLMRKQILDSNWVTPHDKQKLIAKLDTIRSMIGYPEWYTNTTIMPEIGDIDPVTSNAYYIRKFNQLYVSAGYLQEPIYSPHIPFVLEYGSIVGVLGHELYHGFDIKGLQSDIVLRTPWSSQELYYEYINQALCFKNQYEGYKKKAARDLGFSITNFSSTIDEDIADVMGLKLAYSAFKEVLAMQNGRCPVLRGFETFGCEKLFFVAFGNTFCEGMADPVKKIMLAEDVHNLVHIRVNGAVANLEEFSNVFGCTSKDPLKLEKRCDIWQK